MKEPMRISCSCERVAGLDGKQCVRQGPLVSYPRRLLTTDFTDFTDTRNPCYPRHPWLNPLSIPATPDREISGLGRVRAPGECTNLLRQNPTTHRRLNRMIDPRGHPGNPGNRRPIWFLAGFGPGQRNHLWSSNENWRAAYR